MSHTPLPWLRVGRTIYAIEHVRWEEGIKISQNRFYFHIYGGPNTPGEELGDVAQFILTAVNSHYELLAALKEAVSHCGLCDGTGIAYTMEDETQIGQAPGSSGIDCPECVGWRTAIAKTEPPGAGNPG